MTFRDLGRRLHRLVHRVRFERAMDDEMRHHIELETRAGIERGLSGEEARRQALVAFGGVERFKEDARDRTAWRLPEDIGRDLRFAARAVRRRPGFAIAAGLTLALGIGMTATIFSLVRGVLLAPLPYAAPERLVVAWERNVSRDGPNNVVSVPNFELWKERARSFEHLAAMVPMRSTLLASGAAERVSGAEVSPSYFDILRSQAQLGRVLREGDDVEGEPVIVLSNAWWRDRFGARADIVGQHLVLDGTTRTVVGVMPPSFVPPKYFWLSEQAFWAPFVPNEGNRMWGRFLLVLGRLRDGVSTQQASDELAALASASATGSPANEGWTAHTRTLDDQVRGEYRRALFTLLFAVALLLVATLVNLANLALAEHRQRVRELAVRTALGASWMQVVRHEVAYAGMVVATGAAAGALLGRWGIALLFRLLPSDVPRVGAIDSPSVPMFVAVVVGLVAWSIATVIPLSPQLRNPSTWPQALRDGMRTTGRRGGPWLLGSQVALSVVLCVLSALMLRSLQALQHVALGFDARDVEVVRLALPEARYQTPASRRALFADALRAIRRLPGVEAVGAISIRPLGGEGPRTTIHDAGRPAERGAVAPVADVRLADSGYFRAMGIALIAGRTFSGEDRPNLPLRVVVSRTLARDVWPSASPLGKRLLIDRNNGELAEVVGVVDDARLRGPREPAGGVAYLALEQFGESSVDVVTRVHPGLPSLAPSVRRVISGLDPQIPVYQIERMDTLVRDATAMERFTAVVLALFGITALALAAVGVYGVATREVSAREREMGVRLALGASPRGLARLVLGESMRWVLAGAALGVVAASLAARGLRTLLFGVESSDPLISAVVVSLLIGVSVAALLAPARRAGRAVPTRLLQGES